MQSIIKKILLGVFIVAIIISSVMVVQQKYQHSNLHYVQEHEIASFLKDGDIILRLGKTGARNKIKHCMDERNRQTYYTIGYLSAIRILYGNIISKPPTISL